MNFLLLLLINNFINTDAHQVNFYNLSLEEKDKTLGIQIHNINMRRNIYNMTDEEKDRMLGLHLEQNLFMYPNYTYDNITVTSNGYPNKIDLRNIDGVNYISHVKNQGVCGSCVAFAAIGLMENLFLTYGIYKDLSENDLFFCKGSRHCDIGWYLNEAGYVLMNKGTTTESCSPYYTGQCHNCNEIHKIKRQFFIRENKIREFLNKKTAVITYFYVHKNFYDYRSGIYRQTDSNLRGAHAIIIVGYDDTHNYWICKNSWGSWGEGGYFRIKYGEVNIGKYNYVYEMDKPVNVTNDTYVPNCCIKNIPNILLILSCIYLFKFV